MEERNVIRIFINKRKNKSNFIWIKMFVNILGKLKLKLN